MLSSRRAPGLVGSPLRLRQAGTQDERRTVSKISARVREHAGRRQCNSVLTPAPMKPTPVHTCAAARAASPPASPGPNIQEMTYKADPVLTSVIDRSPAGRSASLRSMPTTAPTEAATSSREPAILSISRSLESIVGRSGTWVPRAVRIQGHVHSTSVAISVPGPTREGLPSVPRAAGFGAAEALTRGDIREVLTGVAVGDAVLLSLFGSFEASVAATEHEHRGRRTAAASSPPSACPRRRREAVVACLPAISPTRRHGPFSSDAQKSVWEQGS